MIRQWVFRSARPLLLAGLCGLCASPTAQADDALAAPAAPAHDRDPADPRPAILKNFRQDAALADVCFVDRSRGWAVGDRGTILGTTDGGGTWQPQSSDVLCRLTSVFFVDAHRGWIVGGECRPNGNATRGIVLRTEDGGATWSSVSSHALPLLTRVQFFDSQRGIAIGQATSFQPSGVYRTEDGGKTWRPVPADAAGGWLTGDFLDDQTGAVAGPEGSFATLARRQVARSPSVAPAQHAYHALRLVAPTGGWLVGDGGVVMTTNDLGHSWQSPPTDLPEIVQHFDFQAVAVQGTNVWIAGSPGTCVLHSPDSGQSWNLAFTGQTAPIRSLTFLNAEHGWAVGELGTILVTHDGGRTWKSQRAGAQRAGMLAISAEPGDVPLELISQVGAADGYITAIEVLHQPSARANEQAIDQRIREAMLLAGAAAANTGWRFTLPPDDLALTSADVLEALNHANDGRTVEQIEKHLVRSLRMWRPDVVVASHLAQDENEPRAALLAALLMRSIEAAADPARHIELAAEAGLAAWQVKKVYAVLPFTSRGSESLATGRFSPVLGATLVDFAAPARQLLDNAHSAPPDALELELVMSQAAGDGGAGGVFRGIPSSAAGTRRTPAVLPENDLEELRRTAARRRQLAELLERTQGNEAWSGQIANLTSDLKPNQGAALLAQLADGYRAAGRLDLAADSYFLLARKYSDHALADRALVWLVQFYASSEASHRAAGRKAIDVRQTSFDESELNSPAVGLSRDDRFRRAIQLAEYLKTTRPTLYAEPAVRFAEVAAQRSLGFANPAQRYHLTLQQLPESDPWRQCAETEQWLAKPAELPPPKKLGACRPAPEPPQLDGRLDEPFWSTADKFRLRGESSDGNGGDTAHVRLAYDAEFLYLAVHCPKTFGGDYRLDDSPRPRDADLSQHDRITLRLDIDRDYSTAFEVTVDCRGWTHDACWGDVHWNPNWYVAPANSDDSWTIEAAVPLAEITDVPPAARHVWAIAVRRTIPRTGYEVWAGAPDVEASPAEFGLLLFE